MLLEKLELYHNMSNEQLQFEASMKSGTQLGEQVLEQVVKNNNQNQQENNQNQQQLQSSFGWDDELDVDTKTTAKIFEPQTRNTPDSILQLG